MMFLEDVDMMDMMDMSTSGGADDSDVKSVRYTLPGIGFDMNDTILYVIMFMYMYAIEK